MRMRFLTANDAAGVHPDSWYAATATPIDALPAAQGALRAEICVIGGGYAGLSSALHLAQAGCDVVLIDAHRVGWGASGRNGGNLSYGPRAGMRDYERMLGADDARRVWEVSTEATRLTRRLIAEHAIACDLRPGHLDAAAKPAHAQAMRREAEHLATRYGHEGLRWIDRDEMRARVASPCYHAGLDDPEAGHLHPLDYAFGLARAARAAGARLFERSMALDVAQDASGVTIRTEAGRVRADRAILACNGYLDGLERRVAARVMPINNFIVATEPLGARAQALIPGGECVADSWFVLNYFRISPDGRLLFGGGETYSSRFPRDIAGLVRKPLERVFPQLKGVRIEHAWGGTLAITANRAPLFWRDGARLLSIGGWSGAGVHMATMGGRIAAQAAQGDSATWDLMARAAARPFPGGDRLRPALLAAAMSWYALRDRL